jgi:MFS family permease
VTAERVAQLSCGNQMAPERLRDAHRPWSWTQFALALGLFLVSFLLWMVGLDEAFRPDHNPIAGACGIAAPFITIAGAIWLLILLVRRFTTGRRKPFLICSGIILVALGLFFGTVAFFSPPGREEEEHVFAVISGILFIVALVCVRYAWAETPDPPTTEPGPMP